MKNVSQRLVSKMNFGEVTQTQYLYAERWEEAERIARLIGLDKLKGLEFQTFVTSGAKNVPTLWLDPMIKIEKSDPAAFAFCFGAICSAGLWTTQAQKDKHGTLVKSKGGQRIFTGWKDDLQISEAGILELCPTPPKAAGEASKANAYRKAVFTALRGKSDIKIADKARGYEALEDATTIEELNAIAKKFSLIIED